MPWAVRQEGEEEAVFEILGMAGIAISVAAYVPQVVHLAREHCSAGVSGRAWVMWLVSSILVGMLAVHRRDPVFILLQTCTLTSAAVILILARRYKGSLCRFHARTGTEVGPTVPIGMANASRPSS
jgi:lipid-A-disaccharide synthase-like uncharacterized protein